MISRKPCIGRPAARRISMVAAAIYSTSRATLTSPFSTPAAVTALNQAPSAGAFDGSPSPRGDGLYMLFQSSRSGHNQVWSASRASASVSFGVPTAVAALSSSSDDISPWLSPDGSVMYFSSNRSGTYQIWKAACNGADFNAPALVSEISTSGFNQFPILTPDELVVYWLTTSNIMVATRATTTDPFSNVTVVTELASLAPSGGGVVYITPDRCTIYGATHPGSSTYIVKATKTP
jgi:TolB protein